MKRKYIYRCAVTGKYVSAAYAAKHPTTTMKIEIKLKVCKPR